MLQDTDDTHMAGRRTLRTVSWKGDAGGKTGSSFVTMVPTWYFL